MKAAARFPLVSVFCVALLCGQSGCYGRTETYRLGGVREPVVTVKEGRKGFDVTAGFLPVDAFDPATNEKLNRQKGQGFALIALARFMGIDKSHSVTVSGLTPTLTRLHDRSIELSFSIEKNKIQNVNRPGTMAAESPEFADHKEANVGRVRTKGNTSASSEREADYLDTIALIDTDGRISAAELPQVGVDLYESIADIEEKTLDLFEIVRRQVGADALLQQEERERIFADIQRAHQDFLAALRIELQILEASTK